MNKSISAPNVLGAYRDLGNPEYGRGTSTLACDPNFNRYCSYWLTGETLDATYAALEAMPMLGSRLASAFLDQNRDTVCRFLRGKYRAQTGAFVTNGSTRTEGIFAIHVAIGVMKSIHGIPCHEPLGAERYQRTLDQLGFNSSDSVGNLTEKLEMASLGSEVEGAFLDSPLSPIPSLTVTYMALSTLWNLYAERAVGVFAGIVDVDSIRHFVGSCLQRREFEGKTFAGFSIHPSVTEPCVNTTFFAVGLLDRLGLSEDVIDTETRADIRRFLHLAFRGGGFASTPWEEPSLNATFFGLRCLQLLLEEDEFDAFKRRHAPTIRSFVDSCVNSRNGGAAFSADLDRYVENCLATRYYVQIVHDFLDSEASGSEWRERTFEYLVGQYNEGIGGFRAYPKDRVEELPSNGDMWLESFLDEKDSKLLRYVESSHQPADIDRAYRDLSGLYAEAGAREADDIDLQKKIEAAEGRLAELQHREADRLESQFDSRLAVSPSEALEIVEKIDKLCDDHEDSGPSDGAAKECHGAPP